MGPTKYHSVLCPEEGDGSCWIGPEGYYPVEYEGHSCAAYDIIEEENLHGCGTYTTMYENGYIRVGMRHNSSDVLLAVEVVAGASLTKFSQEVRENLRKLLPGLFKVYRENYDDADLIVEFGESWDECHRNADAMRWLRKFCAGECSA